MNKYTMYADASVNYVVPSKVTSLPVSPLFTTDTGGPRCMTLSLQQQCLLFSFERNSHYSGFFPFDPDRGAEYRSERVGLSVCAMCLRSKKARFKTRSVFARTQRGFPGISVQECVNRSQQVIDNSPAFNSS